MRALEPLVLPLAVAALTAAVFGVAVTHEFVDWDDQLFIYANPALHPPTLASAVAAWTEPLRGLYMPLTVSGWVGLARLADAVAARDALGRPDPALFHAASVMLHVLGALVVRGLLARLLTRGGVGAGAAWAAAAGALLFALHPVQVEPVAWASAMKDLLCGLWSLVALRLYVEFAIASDSGSASRRAWTFYGLALIAFVLALLAKPAAVVVPLLAALLDRVATGRPFARIGRALGVWLLPAAVFAWVATLTQTVPADVPPPLWSRPLIAADALCFYLYRLVLPVGMSVDYGRSPAFVLEQGWVYFTWLVPAALTAAVCLLRERVWRVAWGLFVAALLPVLGLVPFQFQEQSTVADHYLYLAMLGPALACAWLVAALRARTRLAVGAALAVGLGVASGVSLPRFADSERLYEATLQTHPRSHTARYNLGRLLVEQGRPAEAIVHLERALALRPAYARAHVNLGVALMRVDDPKAALPHFERGREAFPADPGVLANLASALAATGRIEEAIALLREAVALAPDYTLARENLETLRRARRRAD